MANRDRSKDDSGRKFRGRGNTDTADAESGERYSGKGSIFNRLDRDGSSSDGVIKSVEGWIIFIRNVNEEANEEDIMDKCSEFGPVKNIQMPLDRRTGFVKGYALVEYEEKSQAEKAIEGLNGTKLLEKPLEVSWAFTTDNKKRS